MNKLILAIFALSIMGAYAPENTFAYSQILVAQDDDSEADWSSEPSSAEEYVPEEPTVDSNDDSIPIEENADAAEDSSYEE